MTWGIWWLFVATEFVLCLTPGPAVCLVLAKALSFGAQRSIFSNLGILAANGMYFALSATSLGAILVASYNLFLAAKWAGAVYLVWIGLRAIFGHSDVMAIQGAGQRNVRGWRLFADGFVLQAANPKAIVFFSALLPQFVNPKAPVAMQILILGVSSVIVEFFVLLFYGAVAGRASEFARQPRYAAWTNRIAGSFLVAAGAGLAVMRRG
jgi:threonine/homoserine/homoserine lactone efflux protein